MEELLLDSSLLLMIFFAGVITGTIAVCIAGLLELSYPSLIFTPFMMTIFSVFSFR
jgi:hypothetical protein